MRTKQISPPVLMAIAATRAMLGMGAGLLLSKRVPRRKREKLGWALLGVGAATTIPLAAKVLRAR
jgi:hypothetical protein